MSLPLAARRSSPGWTVSVDWCVQDPEQLQESANQILTAIIQGMRKEEPSNNVKLAATNALLNSLEFTKANFEKEVDLTWALWRPGAGATGLGPQRHISAFSSLDPLLQHQGLRACWASWSRSPGAGLLGEALEL